MNMVMRGETSIYDALRKLIDVAEREQFLG